MGLKRMILSLALVPFFTACGDLNASIDNVEVTLKDDEVLMGDMIVKRDKLIDPRDEEEEFSVILEEDVDEEDSVNSSGTSARSSNLWNNGTIRYRFGSSISSNEKTRFLNMCAELGAYANVRCRPKRSGDKDFIQIKTTNNPDVCGLSHLGRMGGKQELLISRSCWFDRSTIKHELMHAFGVSHEQAHFDRNDYLKINWDNIHDEYKYAFFKLRQDEVRKHTHFDRNSIMLYHSWAFSKNNKPTMVLRGETGDRRLIYKNYEMSKKDHNILVKLYGGTSPF